MYQSKHPHLQIKLLINQKKPSCEGYNFFHCISWLHSMQNIKKSTYNIRKRRKKAQHRKYFFLVWS